LATGAAPNLPYTILEFGSPGYHASLVVPTRTREVGMILLGPVRGIILDVPTGGQVNQPS
jgi:hypothetical protein